MQYVNLTEDNCATEIHDVSSWYLNINNSILIFNVILGIYVFFVVKACSATHIYKKAFLFYHVAAVLCSSYQAGMGTYVYSRPANIYVFAGYLEIIYIRGYIVGVLDYICHLLFLSCASILFILRFYILKYNTSNEISRGYLILCAFTLTLCLYPFAFYCIFIEQAEAPLETLLETCPIYHQVTQKYTSVTFVPVTPALKRRSLALMSNAAIIFLIGTFFGIKIYILLRSKTEMMSDKTRQMHKLFLQQLILQVCTPLLVMALPIFIHVFCQNLKAFQTMHDTFIYLVISCHGVVNSLAILFSIPTHRQQLQRHINILFNNKVQVQTVRRQQYLQLNTCNF